MTLGELFAGIANAIRSKDGTTDRIPALTFPERILAISGGGVGGGASDTHFDVKVIDNFNLDSTASFVEVE